MLGQDFPETRGLRTSLNLNLLLFYSHFLRYWCTKCRTENFPFIFLQFDLTPSGAEDLADTAIGSFADDNTALNAAYDGVAVF